MTFYEFAALVAPRPLLVGQAVYVLPFAVSAIVTGVAWQWLMNPSSGINAIFGAIGLNFLQNKWYADQNASMNIPDKTRLVAEQRRVLRPGGRLVFQEIFAGPGGDLRLTVARPASA